jgi:hypothetical protein
LSKGAAHCGCQPPQSDANHKKDKEIGHAAGLAAVGEGINSRKVTPRNGNGRQQDCPAPPASVFGWSRQKRCWRS